MRPSVGVLPQKTAFESLLHPPHSYPWKHSKNWAAPMITLVILFLRDEKQRWTILDPFFAVIRLLRLSRTTPIWHTVLIREMPSATANFQDAMNISKTLWIYAENPSCSSCWQLSPTWLAQQLSWVIRLRFFSADVRCQDCLIVSSCRTQRNVT